jgi:hypothetical protein
MLRSFRPLGRAMRSLPQPPGKPRGVVTRIRKTLDYARIKREVMAQIAALSADKQAQVPMMGTLPEIMVGLALTQLGWLFQWQRSELGGRLRVGGAVVDFTVYLGAGKPTVIRVQGDYWHSLPERKLSDEAQASRIRLKGFRLWDAWESAIYQAWLDNRLKSFVEQGVMNAA